MASEKEHAWVTGATGLVGGALCRRLAADGMQIHALVRPRSLGATAGWPGAVRPVPGALPRALEAWAASPAPRVIYHCAAEFRPSDDSDWAARIERVNVDGTRAVAELALERGARLVLVSSMDAVTDGRAAGPVDEDHPCRPGRPYGRSKLAAERLLWEPRFASLDWVVARAPAIYGAGSRFDIVMRLARRIRRRQPALVGPGDKRVSMLYAENFAAALVFLAAEPRARQRIFHVDDGVRPTLRELADLLCELLDRRPPLLSLPWSVGRALAALDRRARPWLGRGLPLNDATLQLFDLEFVFDTRRIEALGFERPTPQREGLRESLVAYRRAGVL